MIVNVSPSKMKLVRINNIVWLEFFLMFVRGKSEKEDKNETVASSDSNNVEINDDNLTTKSKEAHIGSLYHKLVYHPFLRHIRMTKYGWNPDTYPEILDSLRAISWMDGANG